MGPLSQQLCSRAHLCEAQPTVTSADFESRRA